MVRCKLRNKKGMYLIIRCYYVNLTPTLFLTHKLAYPFPSHPKNYPDPSPARSPASPSTRFFFFSLSGHYCGPPSSGHLPQPPTTTNPQSLSLYRHILHLLPLFRPSPLPHQPARQPNACQPPTGVSAVPRRLAAGRQPSHRCPCHTNPLS